MLEIEEREARIFEERTHLKACVVHDVFDAYLDEVTERGDTLPALLQCFSRERVEDEVHTTSFSPTHVPFNKIQVSRIENMVVLDSIFGLYQFPLFRRSYCRV